MSTQTSTRRAAASLPNLFTEAEALEAGYVPVHVDTVAYVRTTYLGHSIRKISGHTLAGGRFIANTAANSSAGYDAQNLRAGAVAWIRLGGRGTVEYIRETNSQAAPTCTAHAFHN